MSLIKLQDALQNYEKTHSECLGISLFNSATSSHQSNIDVEIPGELTIRSRQPNTEKEDHTYSEFDNDFDQSKWDDFPEISKNEQSTDINQSNRTHQRRRHSRMKKKGRFNLAPILIFFVFIMLASIIYAVYDLYTSKRTPTFSSSPNETKLNSSIQKE